MFEQAGRRGAVAGSRDNARMATIEGPLVSATAVVHAALLDPAGERLGSVDDLIVRLADGHYPPVTGLRARVGGRELFVPVSLVDKLEPYRVQLNASTLNLGRFERRAGEVLLDDDILGRRLIDVTGGRLVHANDLALACVDGWWRIVGVDPSPISGLHRIVPWRSRSGMVPPDRLIDWAEIQPFVGHVPSARLLMPLRRLRALHPAQIADLVESASHEEGEEIITAVSADPDLEADVFEELNPEHQREFITDRSDEQAAALLAEMAPDDAADLLGEIDQERRLPILERLPAEQQAKVRRLLSYHPDTAGGMMGTDAVTVSADGTVGDALQAVRAVEELPQQAGSVVVLVDAGGRLVGTVGLSDLVRAESSRRIAEVVEPVTARLEATTDLPDVALLMSDYNMAALPVVDDDGKVLGVVTVDDLLEAMVPQEWRRRRRGDAGD